VFRVERRFVAHGDVTFDRDIVVHPGAVAIVAVDERGRVAMIRQYRTAAEAWLLELPAGTCDVSSESLVQTAQRELREECGLVATQWLEALTDVQLARVEQPNRRRLPSPGL
jgi:ADP-ribose pyrophosphatase